MRKVVFKTFTPSSYSTGSYMNYGNALGLPTGTWSEDYTAGGFFHQWMNSGEAIKAIIENIDGTISLIPPAMMKFIDPIGSPVVQEVEVESV